MAEATKLNGVVMTSSPSPIPSAATHMWSPAVPLEHEIPWAASGERGDLGLEPRGVRTEGEDVAGEDVSTSSCSRGPIDGLASGIR